MQYAYVVCVDMYVQSKHLSARRTMISGMVAASGAEAVHAIPLSILVAGMEHFYGE